MTIKAKSVDEYIAICPEERKEVLNKMREVFHDNLLKGFEEGLSYGMPSFFVPFSKYSAGYHCNPREPLPFLSYALQKNFIALYHSGIYASEKIKSWFEQAYKEITGKQPDMGKSCIRFPDPEKIPFELFSELAEKIDVDE